MHTAPSSGRTLDTCSELYAYCNVVTLVKKHNIYHMWVLQLYLQLLEQYLALCNVLKVIYNGPVRSETCRANIRDE